MVFDGSRFGWIFFTIKKSLAQCDSHSMEFCQVAREIWRTGLWNKPFERIPFLMPDALIFKLGGVIYGGDCYFYVLVIEVFAAITLIDINNPLRDFSSSFFKFFSRIAIATKTRNTSVWSSDNGQINSRRTEF